MVAPDARITEKCIGILLLNRTEECEGHGRKTNLRRKNVLEQFEGRKVKIQRIQPKQGLSFIRHFSNKVKNQRIQLGNEEYFILKIMHFQKKKSKF